MQTEPCHVCGEPNASKHYGSYCCSGCKGFFRRSVRHKRKYTCQNNGKCEIKAEYRNCCRACRFSKCIEAKLNPLMVHGDRGSSSEYSSISPRSVYIKSEIKDEEDTSYANTCEDKKLLVPVVKSERALLLQEEYEKWHKLALNLSIQVCDVNDTPLSAYRIIPEFDKNEFKSVAKYFVLVERLCDDYFDSKACHMFSPETEYKCSLNLPSEKAFFHPRTMSFRTKLDWSARFFINSSGMKQMWCRIVTSYCDWVSHIPEFSQLSASDKLRLIVDRTVPCVDILLVYRSLIYDIKGITFSGGSYFPRDELEQEVVDPVIKPYLKRLSDFLYDEFLIPAKNIQLTESEYALLRILVFFMSADGMSNEGKEMVRNSANFYRNVLSREIALNFPDPKMALERLTNIMSFLRVIEAAKTIEDEGFSVMTLFNIAQLKGELTYEVHIRKGLVTKN